MHSSLDICKKNTTSYSNNRIEYFSVLGVYTLWGSKLCPRDKNTKTMYTGNCDLKATYKLIFTLKIPRQTEFLEYQRKN